MTTTAGPTDSVAARAATAQSAQGQVAQAQAIARPGATKKMTEADADRVARDFESMFLSQMLQPMFEKVNAGKGTFGGGHGEQMFSGLLVDEYAKQISKGPGLGVADMVRKEILRQQETPAAGSSAQALNAGGAQAASGAAPTATASAKQATAAAKVAATPTVGPTTKLDA